MQIWGTSWSGSGHIENLKKEDTILAHLVYRKWPEKFLKSVWIGNLKIWQKSRVSKMGGPLGQFQDKIDVLLLYLARRVF